jgi:hypothetical protein
MTTPERIKRCLRRKQLAKLRDMRAMLHVFKGCIETQTLPATGSPCQEIIKRILKKP